MLEHLDDDFFGTSQHVSKYFADQVVGLLDTEDGSVAKMRLTQASLEALMKLKNLPQPAVASLVERCGRGRGRGRGGKKSSKAISFARVSRRLRRKQAPKEGEDAQNGATGQGVEGSDPDLIFSPADFRRSNKGRRAMSTVMQRLIDLDRTVFPERPLFDPESNLCSVKGLETVQAQHVVQHAPTLWQAELFKIRSPDAFGRRVFQQYTKMFKELRAEKPVRKTLVAFIRDSKATGGDATLNV